MQPIVLSVSGMTCDGCVRSVKAVLKERLGVDAEVDLAASEVRLPAHADRTAAAEAIRDAGFELRT